MSSYCEAGALIREVLVNGDQVAVIRRRATFADMIKRDDMPEWM